MNRAGADYYAMSPEAMLSKATQEIHGDADLAAGCVRDDLLVIRSGKKIVKEEVSTAPDGTLHWFHTVKVPLVKPDGHVLCQSIATDITARRDAEAARRELETQMWQSQKLASLAVLAGGIAHEFNNLLAALRTNAHLAKARLPADSDIRPLFRGIDLAVQRAAQLTEQMLAYGGQGQARLEPLSLATVVDEMSSLFEAVSSTKAQLRLELEPAVVEADARQLHQLISNLVANASDALGGRQGQIVIRTGTRELETAALRSDFVKESLPAGPYAFLEVEDDGCGMAPETSARIFEPFFSTKFVGRGLGLAAVLGIVRRHRGTIQVSSQPDRGTRFVVLLPRASAPVPAAAGAHMIPAAVPIETGGGVLVVDDEALIRETLCLSLLDSGLRALSAGSAREATELFARHRDEIGVVILDLTMPDLNGWQCLEQLRAIRPDISVILISGYSAAASVPAHFEPTPSFFQKPFDPDDLVREAARLLQLRS
jgi:two-component system cell cycle sensor histidine kinase/response regulator CckA